MAVEEKLYTAEDLWALSHRAEDDRRFELIEGEIVEMPPVGGKHSAVTGKLYRLIADYVEASNLGDVTVEAGFILKPDTVCAPDIGFVSKERAPSMTPDRYYGIPPDLAIEVVSPSDTPGRIRRKVSLYLQLGVRMVWVVYPDERFVDVYRADRTVSTFEGDDLLSGNDVIPGLAVAVREVFQDLR